MFKIKALMLSLLSSLLVACSTGGNALSFSLTAFSDGLLPVTIGSSTGYINAKNDNIIPFTYTRAYHFHQGQAIAFSGGNYYLINKIGGRVTNTSYSALILNEAHNNYIFGNDIGYGLLNAQGEVISSTYPNIVPIITSNRMGFYNGVNWGFLNEKGAVAIQPNYQEVYAFSQDLAAVKTNNRWGFIAPNGNVVISPIYDEVVFGFNTFGHAVVQMGSNQLLIDQTGIVIKSGNQISFSDGLYRYRATSTSGYQILKTNGEFLLSTSYYRIWSLYGNRGANVQTTSNSSTDKNIVFDETGNIIVERSYSQSFFKYDMVTNDLYFIDGSSSTKIVTSLKDNKQRPIQAETIDYISNGWIVGSGNLGNVGAYNPTNALTIPFLYEDMIPTEDGYFLVSINSKFGIIDQTGKVIIPLMYDTMFPYKLTIGVLFL